LLPARVVKEKGIIEFIKASKLLQQYPYDFVVAGSLDYEKSSGLKKDELKKILGLNSIIKMIITKIFEKLYDIKYSDRIRKGKDMSDKHLIKYISAVRNFKN
jgi:glycosyltransferase involved in cell wall biosynthesis